MLGVKAFNEKHRKCARITTAFALIVVAILSIILGIAEKICDVFVGLFGSGKRLIAVLVTILLIVAIVAGAIFVKNSKAPKTPEKGDSDTQQIVDTLVDAELSKVEETDKPVESQEPADGANGVSDEPKDTEESAEGVSDETQEVEESTEAISDETQEAEESTEGVSEELQKSDDSVQGASEGSQKTEESAQGKNAQNVKTEGTTKPSDKEPKQEASEESSSENDSKKAPEKLMDLSEVDLEAFMKEYPETVGWLYFEDGHISYPIMQDGDNDKYRKLDYTGEEARTGAIFLDYRSAADFSDSNSIIYGHYMKDRTMFGTLRDYREDPKYYNDHQYFQVITPDKVYRYQIFAYMDVPKSYVLYDYIGDASYEFVKDAEPVRIKSYMDSEIVVNKTKKVVTLSTCTDKDKLYFVVLGVMVEEKDR